MELVLQHLTIMRKQLCVQKKSVCLTRYINSEELKIYKMVFI